jgi:hypothetical protein
VVEPIELKQSITQGSKKIDLIEREIAKKAESYDKDSEKHTLLLSLHRQLESEKKLFSDFDWQLEIYETEISLAQEFLEVRLPDQAKRFQQQQKFYAMRIGDLKNRILENEKTLRALEPETAINQHNLIEEEKRILHALEQEKIDFEQVWLAGQTKQEKEANEYKARVQEQVVELRVLVENQLKIIKSIESEIHENTNL